MPSRFPFRFPQLALKSQIVTPSLVDQRDLIEDMTGKEWHPFITFLELIKGLPKYVEDLKARQEEGTLFCEQRANYELEQVYSIEEFKAKDYIRVFEATEIAEGEDYDLHSKKTRVVVTEYALLILDRVRQEGLEREGEGLWRLTTWGTLGQVDQVNRNMETKDFFTLVWTASLANSPFEDQEFSDEE